MKVLALDLEGTLISNAVSQILLVDDFEKYVHSGQESQWIKAPCFAHPYPEDDVGLSEVLRRLRLKLATSPNRCLTTEKNERA